MSLYGFKQPSGYHIQLPALLWTCSVRKSVTIPCLFPRRSLTPYHRRIESLNASSCHAYSIAEKCRKVKVYQRFHAEFCEKYRKFSAFLCQTQSGGLFLVFLIIRRLIFTLFLENLHDDQSADGNDHTACKEDDMQCWNAGFSFLI